MNRIDALQRISELNGEIFAVEFVKRSTGELRHMVCRTGVRKHLKDSKRTYDPATHLLLTVFDMINLGYRSIPVDGIVSVKIKGRWEDVE